MESYIDASDQVSVCSVNEKVDIVTDESEVLPAFCQSLESVLRQGLKRGIGAFGLADRDYWNCIEGLTSSSRVVHRPTPPVSHVISLVQTCKRVSTSQSRGRTSTDSACVTCHITRTDL